LRYLRRGSGAALVRPLPLVGVLVVLGVLTLALSGNLPGGAGTRAAAQPASVETTPQTDASVPARNVTMLGSSPAEAPGETWGIGQVGSQSHPSWTIVRYSTAEGWSIAPSPLDAAGQPLSGFEPARTLFTEGESDHVLAGDLTASGSGVLAGTIPASEAGASPQKVVLVRNPGGPFQETAPLPSEGETALQTGESLFSETRAPLLAPLDESGHAGALVVPVSAAGGIEDRVLHWDGSSWTAEKIEAPATSEGFRVLAIGASSPSNAWLLAQPSSTSNEVALYRRHPGAEGAATTWLPVAPAPGQAPGAPLTAAGEPFTVPGTGEPPTVKNQVLTVTEEGVWIDGERTDASVRVTMFFKPQAKQPTETGADSGEVRASWCNVTAGATPCTYTPAESLPTGPSRSFAWADPSNPEGFGQRVITGLDEGLSLRLEGDSFERVLALGGSERPNDVGGTRGAAFSEPREGWLGNELLPVHLTVNPLASRLTPYPVSFRHALTAIAPQPGVPVGALSSQALAVGDQGEVARYTPGEGWLPESLFGPGGRIATPRLRGVAWPTPSRAYAVGELGQMWLWRGETGLWEPDPATPPSFRGNLLGIAFDPTNPSRGYAIGQQGVLLGYGKTWTQEALPPGLAGASFTSIAFAGSEAIVAYRLAHEQGGEFSYTGGLLVNDGSGWSVDESAAAALGSDVPWAVAALPDGGAALSATLEGIRGVPLLLERNAAGAPWQPTPAPYPGYEAPGSLALFREGAALRVIGSGGVPDTVHTDDVVPPPAGFPPDLIQPYSIATGYVLRQTAVGWSDEEHDRNEARDPLGEYKTYDMVYQPDPTSAVLVNPTGTQGWAVGGEVDPEQGRNDTADIERYPADGVPPPGFAAAPVNTSSTQATFAIGGGAQCLATCVNRADAGIGPDVWLSSALEQAGQIEGVRAFLYTGPRVSTGAGQGLFPVPYAREYARYAGLLAASSLPAYAVPSATDRGGGNECAFEQAFLGFPAPLGTAAPAPELADAGRSGEPCTTGGQSSYYALESAGAGGTVRVIVLDDSTGVSSTQLVWLTAQLQEANAKSEPAIAIGNADLNAQIAAGEAGAAELARVLVDDGASAYFYEAPEQNVTLPLQVGSSSIPTFGSGTLGYVSSIKSEEQDFDGQSGFLLGEVGFVRKPTIPYFQVSARLIPNIGELALEAEDGVLLRRSQVAFFDALARRPRAGGESPRGAVKNQSAVYIPIPSNCVGVSCASAIVPEYSFSSSRPEIGEFVKPNLAAPDPHTVLLGRGRHGGSEEPIPDEQSGLFCAYNAGTTAVTISTGGFSASLNVKVQAGSVRRPCGTVPLKEIPSQQAVAAPAPAPAPAPASPPPAAAPAPVAPLPPPPAALPPVPVRPVPRTPPPAAFFPPALSAPVLAFVPPPVPTPARPTPPSGTSAVTSPIEVAEHEEEEEGATESVSNQALAYHAPEHEPSPVYILGIVLLAAFAGASIARPRRARRELRVAPATLSAMRAQRRMSGGRRRLR